MNITKGLTLSAAGVLSAVVIAAAPSARADDGSYLDYLHSNHAGAIAGFNDFALLLGGHKACLLPPDQVAAVAPGMPAVSAAVYEAAHHEMCPGA
jgi:hypothetical protein